MLFDEAVKNGGFTYGKSIQANFIAWLRVFLSTECILLILGIFTILGVTGAFGLDSKNLLLSPIVFWLLAMTLTSLFTASFWIVFGPLHGMFNVSLWVLGAMFVVLSSVVFTTTVYNFWPNISSDPPIPFFEFLLGVLIIFSIGAGFVISSSYRRTSFQHYKNNSNGNALELVVPAEKRGRILSVSAQDHYVLITTDKGAHLHRMRLSEAIDRLPDGHVFQVHRSHWVAATAVRKLEKYGNRNTVTLVNGESIPVSVGNLAQVATFVDRYSNQ